MNEEQTSLHQVFLALGANVGDKENHIEQAITLLNECMQDITVAPFYYSKAVGYEAQDDFLNTALVGGTYLSPTELLVTIKEIEQRIGRIQRFRWGPREIDIDILFYEAQIIENPGLQIPHPRLFERDFVLQPLLDLDPEFIHPSFLRSVQSLYDDLPKTAHVIYKKKTRSHI